MMYIWGALVVDFVVRAFMRLQTISVARFDWVALVFVCGLLV